VANPVVPVKTPDGQAELSSRQRRLSQRHRTVLLLVDGRRSEEQVRTLARQAGASDSCYGELLELGLIALPAAAPAIPLSEPVHPAHTDHIDLPLDASRAAPGGDEVESLPPVRTLAPDSVLDSRADATPSDSRMQDLDAIADAADPAMEEARSILMRAVRNEAPLAGSLTLLKLRRARTRHELAQLVDEVESRIIKPFRSLAAQQTLRHVRQLLLSSQVNSALPAG